MSRALLILDSQHQRQKAAHWVANLKDGTRVEFKEPKRTDDQNAKMWAMLTEVATQVKWHGLKLAADDWKLIFMSGLKREMRLVPNIDGDGLVNLSTSSSDLSKGEMSDMIELMFKFGANPDHPVNFREPASVSPPVDEHAAGSGESSLGEAAAEQSAAADLTEAGGHEAGHVDAAAPASEVSMVNRGKSNTDFIKAEMVKKLMELAGDKALSEQERLENLDSIMPASIDRMPGHPTLVKQVFDTAAKVIRSELPRAKAQLYMEGL